MHCNMLSVTKREYCLLAKRRPSTVISSHGKDWTSRTQQMGTEDWRALHGWGAVSHHQQFPHGFSERIKGWGFSTQKPGNYNLKARSLALGRVIWQLNWVPGRTIWQLKVDLPCTGKPMQREQSSELRTYLRLSEVARKTVNSERCL